MPYSDWNIRANGLSEWMDEPCAEGELQACLHDLEQVNRMVFAYRPTLRFLATLQAKQGEPLHIVDVGCGGGDTLRRIEQWARRREIAVALTGVDREERAIHFAQSRNGPKSCIRYIHGDAARHPDVQAVDVVISSHMTHHLRDEEIVTFLRWMQATARVGWLVNDLYRERVPYHAFRLLASCMRWHRFIRHDGPVSVLRSFQPGDWERLLAAAEIRGAEVVTAWPGRLCVQRRIHDA